MFAVIGHVTYVYAGKNLTLSASDGVTQTPLLRSMGYSTKQMLLDRFEGDGTITAYAYNSTGPDSGCVAFIANPSKFSHAAIIGDTQDTSSHTVTINTNDYNGNCIIGIIKGTHQSYSASCISSDPNVDINPVYAISSGNYGSGVYVYQVTGRGSCDVSWYNSDATYCWAYAFVLY